MSGTVASLKDGTKTDKERMVHVSYVCVCVCVCVWCVLDVDLLVIDERRLSVLHDHMTCHQPSVITTPHITTTTDYSSSRDAMVTTSYTTTHNYLTLLSHSI